MTCLMLFPQYIYNVCQLRRHTLLYIYKKNKKQAKISNL